MDMARRQLLNGNSFTHIAVFLLNVERKCILILSGTSPSIVWVISGRCIYFILREMTSGCVIDL